MKVGIIGAGRLGLSIAIALQEKSMLQWICDNDKQVLSTLKRFSITATFYESIEKIDTFPDIILIAVQDKYIAGLASDLAMYHSFKLSGCIIAHSSGSLTTDWLAPLLACNAVTGACHPYQTFPHVSAALLEDTYWAIESTKAFPMLKDLVISLGGQSMELSANDEGLKVLYHLSAVVGSNFMNTLMFLSSSIAKKAGVNAAEILPTITRSTLENNLDSLKQGSPLPLSGPISRADSGTVKSHMNALSTSPRLREIYKYLALATLETALMEGLVNEGQYQEMKAVLNKPSIT